MLPQCRPRGTNYTTTELLELLKAASAQVHARYPDTRIAVCNASLPRGGPIRWSRSHQSGRDVDLAFLLTRRGKPVPSPGLVRLGRNLKGPGGLAFDVERTWALVKALVSHPKIHVQWIFVAWFLKRALLDYALAHERDRKWVTRAAHVLHQPSDSLSHDDHFHVRIYCSREDVAEGCLDFGPRWPWVPDFTPIRRARIRLLLEGLEDSRANVRLRVVQTLARMRAREVVDELARATLQDEDAQVRRAGLRLLETWRPRRDPVVRALTALLGKTSCGKNPCFLSRRELLQAYHLLSMIATDAAIPFLLRRLRRAHVVETPDGGKVDTRLYAASVCLALPDPRLVPGLLEALAAPDPKLRVVAARALRRATNWSFGYRWSRLRSARARRRALRRWRRWWRRRRTWSRKRLVLAGLRRYPALRRALRYLQGRRGLATLVRLTGRHDHLGYNASWLLTRLCRCRGGHGLPPAKRLSAWRRWYGERFPRRRRRGRRRLRPQGRWHRRAQWKASRWGKRP